SGKSRGYRLSKLRRLGQNLIRRGGDEAFSLISSKKEQSIFQDRSAESNPELVQPNGRLDSRGWVRRMVGKKRIGIECIVAQEPPTCAVEPVRSGLCDYACNCTGAASKLCGIVQPYHLQFFN